VAALGAGMGLGPRGMRDWGARRGEAGVRGEKRRCGEGGGGAGGLDEAACVKGREYKVECGL
jgi:hypothetical protein